MQAPTKGPSLFGRPKEVSPARHHPITSPNMAIILVSNSSGVGLGVGRGEEGVSEVFKDKIKYRIKGSKKCVTLADRVTTGTCSDHKDLPLRGGGDRGDREDMDKGIVRTCSSSRNTMR